MNVRRSVFARAARVVAVNAGLIVAALLLIELVFGSWIFGENYGALVIPKNFTRHYDASRLYEGGGKTVYVRDEFGLRGRYGDVSGIDILVIGGSTTNEIFITEGKTWTDVLAGEFRRAGKPMRVANAGVDGQSTIGNNKNFELWFPKIAGLKARYVLALLGINDSAVAVGGEAHLGSPFRLTKQDRMFDLLRPTKQYLMNNSSLYALFRNVRGILRARDAKLIHKSGGYNGAVWREPDEQPDLDQAARTWKFGLDLYERRLRELTHNIRAFGAEPIYVTQHRPSYRIRDGRVLGRVDAAGRVELPNYAALMAVNRRTMEVCRDVGAICVDLAAELFFEDGDHYDEVHTTPRGSEKIGRYLFEKLQVVIE